MHLRCECVDCRSAMPSHAKDVKYVYDVELGISLNLTRVHIIFQIEVTFFALNSILL